MGSPFLAQPYLISNQNIKTVGGESLLGPGDIDAVSNADLQSALAAYTPTSNLAPVATSGSASDLLTGTLPNARLSPQVVRSDFSYPDPSWVTSIAASKLTGTLADARLSSNVPLKNASQLFTGGNTFQATQVFESSICVGTGGTGPRIRNNGQAFRFNNNADTARADIEVGSLIVSTGSTNLLEFRDTANVRHGYLYREGGSNDVVLSWAEGSVSGNRRLRFVVGSSGLTMFSMETSGAATFTNLVNGAFRASGTSTPTTGNGLEVFMSGSTAFLQNYNRDTLVYQPIRMQGTTLDFIGTSTFTGEVTVTGQSLIAGVRFDPSSLNTIWQSVSGRNLSINTNGGLVILGAGSSTNHLQIDTAGTATFSGNLVPGANATYDIGTSISMRWNRVFSNTLRVGSNGLEIGQNNYSVTLPRAEIGDFLGVGVGVSSETRINLQTAGTNAHGILLRNLAGQTAAPFRIVNSNGVDQISFNADGGATFTGLVSLSGISGRIANTSYSQTNSLARFGSCEIQPFDINNVWIGENYYYNGSNFVRRSPGFASGIYFHNGNVQLVSAGNDVAGSVIPSGCKFKVTPSGRIASGNSVATGGDDATGATFSVDGSGNLVASGTVQIGGTSGPMIRNSAGALEVRNSTDAEYANINANNGLFNGSIQIGSTGGPQLVRLSNVLTVKNLSNTDYASLAALQLISTVASGGSNASPADSRITLRTLGISYIAADVIGRTYANNAAHGDLILRARPNIGAESTSDDFVIRGNTGNVEINRGRLVLVDTVNASSWGLKTIYSDTPGQLDFVNHSNVTQMKLTQTGLLTVVGALGVGADPGVNRLHLAAATVGSSVTYLNSIVSAKANADTSAHFRLTRTGISEWYVNHNGAGNLELALAGNLANPDFTFGGGGVFIANNQIKIGNASGVRLQRNLEVLHIKNDADTDFATVALREIRLNGYTYGRVAQVGSAGDWAGGYNINYNSSSINRDSTGTVNGIHYATTGIHFFSEASGAPGAISPRMTLSPTQLVNVGEIVSQVAGNTRIQASRTGASPSSLSIGAFTSSPAFEWDGGDLRWLWQGSTEAARMFSNGNFRLAGMMQLGGASGVFLKNSSGALQVRNSADSDFVSIDLAQANGFAFQFVDGVSRAGKFYFYTNNGNSVLYFRDTVNARQHMQFNPGANSSSAETYIWSTLTVDSFLRVQQNDSWLGFSGNNYLSNVTYFKASGTNKAWINGSNGQAQFDGHITSAFQTLSADPSTLDISSGMSRLVKNTTSGEIRWFVNDGGTIKKSAAFT